MVFMQKLKVFYCCYSCWRLLFCFNEFTPLFPFVEQNEVSKRLQTRHTEYREEKERREKEMVQQNLQLLDQMNRCKVRKDPINQTKLNQSKRCLPSSHP